MFDDIFSENNMLLAKMNFDHDQKLNHDQNQKNLKIRNQKWMSSDWKFQEQNKYVTTTVFFKQIKNKSVKHDHDDLFSKTHKQQFNNQKKNMIHHDQIIFRQDIRKNRDHQWFSENDEKAHDEDDCLTSSVLSDLRILLRNL